ncbi:MAG: type II methionyl aminopeptidase [Candidatus Marsarchaeota archaeon]|nr:type II methionyl aminopeptidase [Candidatus Marsarchaeota archaeon]
MNYEEAEKGFVRAGEILAKALTKAPEFVHEGASVMEICERMDALVSIHGCQPAFPTNVSVNSVAAHDTASLADPPTTIPKRAVVKVDAGSHFNGYVTDSAITISFNEDAAPIVEASRTSLELALSKVRLGMPVGELGSVIEEKIRSYKVNPIVDLTGHTIERYNLHAGVNVPNVSNRIGYKLNPGVAIAIEPFATFGTGEIKDSDDGKIYRGLRKVRSPIRFDQRIMEYALDERKGLPFSDRWLRSIGPRDAVLSSIRRLVRFGGLYEYKVLLEKSGGLVAQFEHTLFMSTDGPLVVTAREV